MTIEQRNHFQFPLRIVIKKFIYTLEQEKSFRIDFKIITEKIFKFQLEIIIYCHQKHHNKNKNYLQ
jgi:hypothetical protein